MNEVSAQRLNRHRRVRKKISGSSARPRLAVYRSNKYVYAQVIDDSAGRTIVSASSLEPDVRGAASGNSKEAAQKVGTLLAARALEMGIKTVVFDRGGYRFHGKVKALADGAREKGLEF